MKIPQIRFALLLLGSLVSASAVASAQEAAKPHVPLQKTIGQVTHTAPEPSLAVINSTGATLDGTKLTLTGVAPNSIVFADRPVRAAGHVTTKQFIMQWDEGKDSFAKDPPNATISVLGGDGSAVEDAVVTLKKPVLEGTTLTFEVAVLEGSLSGGSGPAALFIDFFAAHYGGYHGGVTVGHVGGYGYHGGGAYWHAPAYHGAWYGAGAVAGAAVAGAAVGAAAATAAPYYRPACGYYPYPPCY
ncbi:hypothetical protein [Rhodoligotrophos appendicifer]|uniref:hypothetical protein n=1 Tax=Rhodoligotrophos appendicifer TaxID=987056 RepID=UPI001186415B|nr:hypothetical protein [Rhodoligotrophos appendicifer]